MQEQEQEQEQKEEGKEGPELRNPSAQDQPDQPKSQEQPGGEDQSDLQGAAAPTE